MQPSFTTIFPLPKHHLAKSKNSPLFQKLDHTFPKMDIFKNVLFSKTTPTFFIFERYIQIYNLCISKRVVSDGVISQGIANNNDNMINYQIL